MQKYEIGNQYWYIVAREFPTALMAKIAWEKANENSPGNIGILRLAPNNAPDAMRVLTSGEPCGHMVVGVTDKEESAVKAEELIKGNEKEVTEEFMRVMVLRRAKIILNNLDKLGQKLVIRRPDDRGAYLDALGNTTEQKDRN